MRYSAWVAAARIRSIENQLHIALENVSYSAMHGENTSARIDYRDMQRPLKYFEIDSITPEFALRWRAEFFVLQMATFPVGEA